MSPEWIVAICAGVTLLILMMSTVVAAALWVVRQVKEMKAEILADFDLKHKDNSETVMALEELVMRHDLILQPEFNGSGRSAYVPKHRPRQ